MPLEDSPFAEETAMRHDDILPNDDGFWPAMAWSEGFLPSELIERVRGYAEVRDLEFREAVIALLEGALDQRAQRAAGGRKRWAGVTPSERREHATRAAQARWGTRLAEETS
jgi:succinyl-CoA synthetase beta subunit